MAKLIKPHTRETVKQALLLLEEEAQSYGAAFYDSTHIKSYCRLKLSNKKREHFVVMFLTNQHQMIKCKTVFKGTIDSAPVYPREIARLALKHNAAAVFLMHNHPSGTTKPSTSDEMITKRIQTALALFDINVLDHIIVGGTDTYSFAEHSKL